MGSNLCYGQRAQQLSDTAAPPIKRAVARGQIDGRVAVVTGGGQEKNPLALCNWTYHLGASQRQEPNGWHTGKIIERIGRSSFADNSVSNGHRSSYCPDRDGLKGTGEATALRLRFFFTPHRQDWFGCDTHKS